MISKELFCKALRMIVEQEKINHQFEEALQMVGNGHFVFGTPNKFYDALLEVLKETVGDRYDYISWWLYEGEPDYEVWTENETKTWCLKEPEALYDFSIAESRYPLEIGGALKITALYCKGDER